MDIRLYTDIENEDYVLIDTMSLLHAYEYAVKVENNISVLLKNLFSQGDENVRIEKNGSIYQFLKNCPNVTIDEINLQTIIHAYVVARLQNNTLILRKLGKVLGHWRQYVKENNEQEGIYQEIKNLPKEVQHYILKHHDILSYQEQTRMQNKKVIKEKEVFSNRSVVEIGNFEKIYKRSA